MPNKTTVALPLIQPQRALSFLEKNNFSGFLDEIALLGEWLQNYHKLSHYKGNDARLATLLKQTPQLNIPSLTTQQALSFKTLAHAWQDTPVPQVQKNLKAKAPLRKDIRHRLKLGMEAFKLLCVGGELEENTSSLQQTVDRRSPAEESTSSLNLQRVDQISEVEEKQFRKLDAAAQKAIRNYKTWRQKIKRVVEYTLAALTAFAYGTVEMVATMLGFFAAAGIVWTNPWLALLGVLLLAGAIIFPIPSTWTNWKIFSTYLPAFFDKIGDEYQEINSPKKKALFWLLSIFAFATGIAAGGLAYTATIALPAMMGLGTISLIFPPLGLILAAAITLTQTFTLLRNFAGILRKKDSWQALKEPFLEVKRFLNENQASWGRRLIIWSMVLGLALIALVGLAMSCFTSTRAVGKLFIDQFHTAPQKALICGIVISAVCSFFSRIYLTLSSTLASAIDFSKRLFKGEPSATTREPHPIPLKKIMAILIDSVLAGLFYAWSMISLCKKTPADLQQDIDLHLGGMSASSTTALATVAGLTSFVRNSAVSFDHAAKPENIEEEARQQYAAERVKKNIDFYRHYNNRHLFSPSSASNMRHSDVGRPGKHSYPGQ